MRRKKFEVKRKITKAPRSNEKCEKGTQMRMILEKWIVKENSEKVQNEIGKKRGEKRKPDCLTRNESGTKSVSQSSLGSIENGSLMVKNKERVVEKKSTSRHSSENGLENTKFQENVQKKVKFTKMHEK